MNGVDVSTDWFRQVNGSVQTICRTRNSYKEKTHIIGISETAKSVSQYVLDAEMFQQNLVKANRSYDFWVSLEYLRGCLGRH
jgi:hypothetical protein